MSFMKLYTESLDHFTAVIIIVDSSDDSIPNFHRAAVHIGLPGDHSVMDVPLCEGACPNGDCMIGPLAPGVMFEFCMVYIGDV